MLLPWTWQLSIHHLSSQMSLQLVRAARNGFSLISKLEWSHWPHNTHAPFFFFLILNLGQLFSSNYFTVSEGSYCPKLEGLSLLRWACGWMEGGKQKAKLKRWGQIGELPNKGSKKGTVWIYSSYMQVILTLRQHHTVYTSESIPELFCCTLSVL